jgi:hypothetical protein
MLDISKAIWNVLWIFGIFYNHLVRFVFIWYIFSGFWYRVPRKIWQPWIALSAFQSLTPFHETRTLGKKIPPPVKKF